LKVICIGVMLGDIKHQHRIRHQTRFRSKLLVSHSVCSFDVAKWFPVSIINTSKYGNGTNLMYEVATSQSHWQPKQKKKHITQKNKKKYQFAHFILQLYITVKCYYTYGKKMQYKICTESIDFDRAPLFLQINTMHG